MWRLYGEGPNDTGLAGRFSEPVNVSRELGLRDGQDFLIWPGGAVVPSNKGLWNLNAGFGLERELFGQRVKDIEDTEWTAVSVAADKPYLGFGTASGLYIFDYVHREWLFWTENVNSRSLIPHGHDFALANSTEVRESSSSVGTKDLYVTTGWINLDRILGFGRCRRIHLLANYIALSNHAIVLTITRSDASTESQTLTLSKFSRVGAVRMKPARQKESRIKIQIKVDRGSSTTGAVLNGLRLRVTAKRKYPLKANNSL